MKIELDPETFANAIAKELKEQYWNIKDAYDAKKHQRMFDNNELIDSIEVKKLLKAIKKVHDYYSIYSIDEYLHGDYDES